MNSVNLVGQLIQKPEIYRMRDGSEAITFRLLVHSVSDTNPNIARVDEVSIIVPPEQKELGKTCITFLRDKSNIALEGSLRVEVVEDGKYFIAVVARKITFLDSPKEEGGT
jgi:single-stranded DNA-binding protein